MKLTLQKFETATNGISRTTFGAPTYSNKWQLNRKERMASRYSKLNCREATEKYVQQQNSLSHDNDIQFKIWSEEAIKKLEESCQIAKEMNLGVNDSLMVLLLLVACGLNMIFQSTIPIFNGKYFKTYVWKV